MRLLWYLQYLLYWFVIYCIPSIFIFFLVITLAMKERDTKLKIREITQNIFKLIFR